MIEPNRFEINDYLGRVFECNCGRLHSTPLEIVDISAGAIQNIPLMIKRWGCERACVVSDINTYCAAGKLVAETLSGSGIGVMEYIFPQHDLVPDEKSIGSLLTAFDPSCDIVIAVGTGTINDICKFLSYKLRLEYIIVATAPSMDGFASGGAALITENLKTTYETHVARAIVGDLDILSKAPMELLTAGFADILGKCSCLCDWKLSAVINGEYYCDTIVEMVKTSIKRVTGRVEELKNRDPQAIKNLTEALVLTGIAMSFVGNSRPASGCEHHLSHFWEMRFLLDGRKPVLHGAKVGIGTVASLKSYSILRNLVPDYNKAVQHAEQFDVVAWQDYMRRVYNKAAEGVIELEKRTMKNSAVTHRSRLAKIKENYPLIQQILDTELTDYHLAEDYLRRLDAPYRPQQVGVDRGMVIEAFVAAKEVRDRYTMLQLLWDLGELDAMSEKIADYLEEETEDTGGLLIVKN